MSELVQRIAADRDTARRARDSVRANLLGTLLGTITTKEKAGATERKLSDAEVIAEIKKLLDGIHTTMVYCQAHPLGREEQAAEAAREKALLDAYVPEQMSETALIAFTEPFKQQGASLGVVMKALKDTHPGEYDGVLASAVVRQVLAG